MYGLEMMKGKKNLEKEAVLTVSLLMEVLYNI